MNTDITYCNATPYDECETCRHRTKRMVNAVFNSQPVILAYPPALVDGKCPEYLPE